MTTGANPIGIQNVQCSYTYTVQKSISQLIVFPIVASSFFVLVQQ